MLYFHDGIIVADSKKEAITKCLAKPNGVRLYLLFQSESLFLISFYSNNFNLKSLGFTLDDYYYIKSSNIITKDGDFDKQKVSKLLKFKNSKAINELKTYIAESSNNYDDGYWYAVIENQGFLVSYEKEPGFVKVPARPLYKEVSNISSLKLAIKKIQKVYNIANPEELNKVCKAYFGSELDNNINEDFELEYTDEFLNDQFELFNEKYFGNKLPKIPCRWKKMKVYGLCFHNYYEDRIDVKEIVINRTINNYKEFRDTMVHEMCHAYCDITTPEKDIRWATQEYGFRTTKWKRALGLTDETCHSGRWLELIKTLNARFPELHLKRSGSSNYEHRDESGKIKKEIIDQLAKCHLLVRKFQGKSILKLFNEENYQRLLNRGFMGSMTYPFGGDWVEYDFEPKLLAEIITKTTDTVSGYKIRVLKMLKDMGALGRKRNLFENN